MIGNRFDDILNNPNIDAETKLELRNYILLHDEAAVNLESFMKNMSKEDLNNLHKYHPV